MKFKVDCAGLPKDLCGFVRSFAFRSNFIAVEKRVENRTEFIPSRRAIGEPLALCRCNTAARS